MAGDGDDSGWSGRGRVCRRGGVDMACASAIIYALGGQAGRSLAGLALRTRRPAARAAHPPSERGPDPAAALLLSSLALARPAFATAAPRPSAVLLQAAILPTYHHLYRCCRQPRQPHD